MSKVILFVTLMGTLIATALCLSGVIQHVGPWRSWLEVGWVDGAFFGALVMFLVNELRRIVDRLSDTEKGSK